MAYKLEQLAVVTIASTATSQQVSALNVSTPAVFIQADPLNTGKIYVGNSSVSSANGIALGPEEHISLDSEHLRGNSTDFMLSDIYVATATNGNKVRVSYLVRR